MADFNVKDEAHVIASKVFSAKDMTYREGGALIAKQLLDDAHQEVCSNSPEHRKQILDLWTRAKHVKNGSGAEVGVVIKNLYLSFECPEK